MRSEHIDLLLNLIDSDIERVAWIIDLTVKQINTYNETENNQALMDLAMLLGELETETLLDLLIKIAELPETPSIAAEILMSLSPELTVNITKLWITSGKTQLLSNVFDFFSIEYYDLLYRSFSSAERIEMYPFWSQIVISGLPHIGEFKVTEVLIDPLDPLVGEEVTIEALIVNVGDETDDVNASLAIDGIIRDQYIGLLSAGEGVSLGFTTVYMEPGNYVLQVLTNISYFEIVSSIQPEPGKMQVTSIEVVPSQVLQTQTFSVFVTVTNLGDSLVTDNLEVLVDSEVVASQLVTIQSESTETVVIEIIADLEAGQHILEVRDYQTTFEVLEKSAMNPVLILMGVIVVLLVGGFFLEKKTGIVSGFLDNR